MQGPNQKLDFVNGKFNCGVDLVAKLASIDGLIMDEKKGKDDTIKEAVFKVYVHCEGCSKKVVNCVKGFYGVEDAVIDDANHIVIVKGQNVDPIRVLGRFQKKFNRNVELISPLPKRKDDNKVIVPEKEAEPQVETLMLRMYMHCERCAHDITRNIERMRGIMFVETDMAKSIVIIKGIFDAPKLVNIITRRLGKHVAIVKQESKEGSKESDEKKAKNEAKESDENIGNECEQQILVPFYTAYIHPSLVLSDDNVFGCSIL